MEWWVQLKPLAWIRTVSMYSSLRHIVSLKNVHDEAIKCINIIKSWLLHTCGVFFNILCDAMENMYAQNTSATVGTVAVVRKSTFVIDFPAEVSTFAEHHFYLKE